jgi:hypothetical protein
MIPESFAFKHNQRRYIHSSHPVDTCERNTDRHFQIPLNNSGFNSTPPGHRILIIAHLNPTNSFTRNTITANIPLPLHLPSPPSTYHPSLSTRPRATKINHVPPSPPGRQPSTHAAGHQGTTLRCAPPQLNFAFPTSSTLPTTLAPVHKHRDIYQKGKKMSHETVYYSRPRTYGKGSREW